MGFKDTNTNSEVGREKPELTERLPEIVSP
jgi:hypothetical protein